jgi:hypothetical protein
MRLDWPDSDHGVVASGCEHGSIKCRLMLEQLNDYQLIGG